MYLCRKVRKKKKVYLLNVQNVYSCSSWQWKESLLTYKTTKITCLFLQTTEAGEVRSKTRKWGEALHHLRKETKLCSPDWGRLTASGKARDVSPASWNAAPGHPLCQQHWCQGKLAWSWERTLRRLSHCNYGYSCGPFSRITHLNDAREDGCVCFYLR